MHRRPITQHAVDQVKAKGYDPEDVRLALVDPDVTYPSRNHPGQVRHIRGDICVIVQSGTVITVYKHKEETPLRPDQVAAGVTTTTKEHTP